MENSTLMRREKRHILLMKRTHHDRIQKIIQIAFKKRILISVACVFITCYYTLSGVCVCVLSFGRRAHHFATLAMDIFIKACKWTFSVFRIIYHSSLSLYYVTIDWNRRHFHFHWMRIQSKWNGDSFCCLIWKESKKKNIHTEPNRQTDK